MPRGGKREGAGRKPGTPNTKTSEIAARALAEGISPLEFLMKVVRGEYPDADFSHQLDAAKAAAPYCHAKIAPIDASDGGSQKVRLEVVTGVPRSAD